MKQILIILGLFASVTTFAQSPRIKLNQITKDTVKGSVLISSPSDSGMVYSRDFYIAYGADTVLILYGDTLAATSGIISSVFSDGVTITGDGTTGNELKVDTSLIATISALNDSLATVSASTTPDGVTITGDGTTGNELKVDTSLIATISALNDSLATVSASTTPDGVTITGDGSVGNPLKVDTATIISTIQGLVDTLTARGYLTANETITLSGDVTGSGTTAITATVVDDSHNHIISNVDFLQDSLTAKANASELSNYLLTSNYIVDSTRINATGDTAFYYQNGVEIGSQSIAGGGGTTYNNISETADTVFIDKYLNVDTSTLYVDATNNRVGIGTSSPSAPLEILTPAINGRENSLKIKLSDAGNDVFGIGNGTSVDARFNPVFYGFTNSNSFGGLLFRGMITADVDTLNSGVVAFQTGMTSDITDPNNNFGGSISNRPTFQFYNNTTVQMQISANGNVGIGTTSPEAKFTVLDSLLYVSETYGAVGINQKVNTSNNTLTVKAASVGNGDVGIKLFTDSTGTTNTDGFNFGIENSTLDVYINQRENADVFFYVNGGIRLKIEPDGGIFMPDVYSDLISGTTRDLYIKSDGQLGYISSTAKSKTNIYDLNNVDFIYNLNPVSFNYRKQNDKGEFTDEFYDKTSYGLIAEEVVNVADYMVYYDELEDGGFIPVGVNYSELITPMLKAIQQQKDEIDQLKTLITDLTNRIQILENK